ncbi:MAG: HAD family phosphatase, partial [Alistipes sp.]|nr:HAD family phosphatase [Alistipes sp.]
MNNNLPFNAAIFDMDGTLVDNSAVHVRAFELFCNRYGVTDWRTKLEKAFGMGSDDIMRMLLPEEIIRERGLQALGDEK